MVRKPVLVSEDVTIPERNRRGPRARREPRRDPAPNVLAPPEVIAVFRRGAAAWPEFLRAFTPFLLACTRRLASDYDERMEIYLHVCARLRAEQCRRIRQFRGSGSNGECKFTTWLAAVALNLGREWIRTHRGRRRYFRRIQVLSYRERLIFRYRFWEGFEVGEISRLIRLSHGLHCSEAEVVASLRRMRDSLGNDQIWRLVRRDARTVRHVPIDPPGPRQQGRPHHEPAAVGEAPAATVTRNKAVAVLRQSVAELPELERQAITLRFRDGYSAREIAAHLGLDNYKRIYELQARALTRLRKRLRQRGVDLADFGSFPGRLELLR